MPYNRSGWFDWSLADAVWEQTSEAAVLAHLREDRRGTAAEAEQALELARKHFARGDPRLAASYLNRALTSTVRGSGESTALHDHALTVLTSTWAWIPPKPADDPEQGRTIELAWELVRQIRRLIEHSRSGAAVPDHRFEVWRQERSHFEGGLRKVAAAALLILPA